MMMMINCHNTSWNKNVSQFWLLFSYYLGYWSIQPVIYILHEAIIYTMQYILNQVTMVIMTTVMTINCFFRFAFAIFTFTAIIRSPNQYKVWNDMNKNQNHNTKKGFWVEKTNLLQLKRLQQFKMIQLMTKVFIKTKRTREIVCTPPPLSAGGGQKGGLDRNLIFRGRLVRIRGVT